MKRTLILIVLITLATGAQSLTVEPRKAWEIISFASRSLKTDTACREKLGIVKPPKDQWYLGCGGGQ